MLGNEAADDDTCGIVAEALAQGIFLRSIDNKTIRRLEFILFTYVLFSVSKSLHGNKMVQNGVFYI